MSVARKTTARDAYEARTDLLARARDAYQTLARQPGWLVVDADAVRKLIYDRFDCSLGTGLGKVRGRMFRIGHLYRLAKVTNFEMWAIG